MKDWYHTHASSNIDRIIYVFQEKKQILSPIVVPIYNDNQFIMLDIFIPCDIILNSQVTIYDYLDLGDKDKHFSAKMWWSNFWHLSSG